MGTEVRLGDSEVRLLNQQETTLTISILCFIYKYYSGHLHHTSVVS